MLGGVSADAGTCRSDMDGGSAVRTPLSMVGGFESSSEVEMDFWFLTIRCIDIFSIRRSSFAVIHDAFEGWR